MRERKTAENTEGERWTTPASNVRELEIVGGICEGGSKVFGRDQNPPPLPMLL